MVLTHNRLVALRECLVRIETGTREQDREIIVVDNGSTDGTHDWLIRNWHDSSQTEIVGNVDRRTSCFRPSNEGVCARNHAIDIARGEIIAQVDDDVLVTPGWDEVLLAPFDDSTIGATGQHGFYQEQTWERTPWSAGLIDDRRRPSAGQLCDFVMGFTWAWRAHRQFDHCPEEMEEPVGEPHPDTGLLACQGCDEAQLGLGDCAAITTPRFRYDEAFNPFWHEESDLQLQIRAAGYRIACVREIASHVSLPHLRDRDADIALAARNFDILKRKWQHNERIRYEGKGVGL